MKTLLAILFPVLLFGQTIKKDSVIDDYTATLELIPYWNTIPKDSGWLTNMPTVQGGEYYTPQVQIRDTIISHLPNKVMVYNDSIYVKWADIKHYKALIYELFVWHEGKKRILIEKVFRE